MKTLIYKFTLKINSFIKNHRFGLIIIAYLTFLDWVTHGFFVDIFFSPGESEILYPVHEKGLLAFLIFPILATIFMAIVSSAWTQMRKKFNN
jgi:hypothetical protein